MNIQFSENVWEQISSLWNEKKKKINLDITDQSVKEMLDIWFICRRTAASDKSQVYDEKRAWSNIERRTAIRGYKKWASLLKYVAVFVVGILGLVLWLTKQPDLYVAENHVSKMKVVSSLWNQKAELILANGETIVLDTNTNKKLLDVKFINNTGKGKLSYSGDEENGKIGFHTLNIPQGGEYMLQLPDSTCIWLNSESSIRFPIRFEEDKREIFLDGEAYFKVAKNEHAPFLIHVRECIVTVLGTSLNISAYANDRYWETTLVEGRVVVENKGEKIEMKPSNQYSVDNETGQGILKQVNTYLYTSWVDGKFYFNACRFEDIVKKLERWYDFTMSYQDEEIKYMRFSGTVNKHCPLNEILNFLERTTNIHFEIVGKNVVVKRIEKNKR